MDKIGWPLTAHRLELRRILRYLVLVAAFAGLPVEGLTLQTVTAQSPSLQTVKAATWGVAIFHQLSKGNGP